jgi:isoquinoline 1-oxidoreductase beta subunit
MTFHPSLPTPKTPKLSRRTFFVTSAAAGGLVLGVRLPQSEAAAATDEGSEFNAFVQVMPDNRVSIVVPGVEIGQGVYTTLPKIVAEEI